MTTKYLGYEDYWRPALDAGADRSSSRASQCFKSFKRYRAPFSRVSKRKEWLPRYDKAYPSLRYVPERLRHDQPWTLDDDERNEDSMLDETIHTAVEECMSRYHATTKDFVLEAVKRYLDNNAEVHLLKKNVQHKLPTTSPETQVQPQTEDSLQQPSYTLRSEQLAEKIFNQPYDASDEFPANFDFDEVDGDMVPVEQAADGTIIELHPESKDFGGYKSGALAFIHEDSKTGKKSVSFRGPYQATERAEDYLKREQYLDSASEAPKWISRQAVSAAFGAQKCMSNHTQQTCQQLDIPQPRYNLDARSRSALPDDNDEASNRTATFAGVLPRHRTLSRSGYNNGSQPCHSPSFGGIFSGDATRPGGRQHRGVCYGTGRIPKADVTHSANGTSRSTPRIGDIFPVAGTSSTAPDNRYPRDGRCGTGRTPQAGAIPPLTATPRTGDIFSAAATTSTTAGAHYPRGDWCGTGRTPKADAIHPVTATSRTGGIFDATDATTATTSTTTGGRYPRGDWCGTGRLPKANGVLPAAVTPRPNSIFCPTTPSRTGGNLPKTSTPRRVPHISQIADTSATRVTTSQASRQNDIQTCPPRGYGIVNGRMVAFTEIESSNLPNQISDVSTKQSLVNDFTSSTYNRVAAERPLFPRLGSSLTDLVSLNSHAEENSQIPQTHGLQKRKHMATVEEEESPSTRPTLQRKSEVCRKANKTSHIDDSRAIDALKRSRAKARLSRKECNRRGGRCVQDELNDESDTITVATGPKVSDKDDPQPSKRLKVI